MKRVLVGVMCCIVSVGVVVPAEAGYRASCTARVLTSAPSRCTVRALLPSGALVGGFVAEPGEVLSELLLPAPESSATLAATVEGPGVELSFNRGSFPRRLLDLQPGELYTVTVYSVGALSLDTGVRSEEFFFDGSNLASGTAAVGVQAGEEGEEEAMIHCGITNDPEPREELASTTHFDYFATTSCIKAKHMKAEAWLYGPDGSQADPATADQCNDCNPLRIVQADGSYDCNNSTQDCDAVWTVKSRHTMDLEVGGLWLLYDTDRCVTQFTSPTGPPNRLVCTMYAQVPA